jgi:hypothetical protein
MNLGHATNTQKAQVMKMSFGGRICRGGLKDDNGTGSFG